MADVGTAEEPRRASKELAKARSMTLVAPRSDLELKAFVPPELHPLKRDPDSKRWTITSIPTHPPQDHLPVSSWPSTLLDAITWLVSSFPNARQQEIWLDLRMVAQVRRMTPNATHRAVVECVESDARAASVMRKALTAKPSQGCRVVLRVPIELCNGGKVWRSRQDCIPVVHWRPMQAKLAGAATERGDAPGRLLDFSETTRKSAEASSDTAAAETGHAAVKHTLAVVDIVKQPGVDTTEHVSESHGTTLPDDRAGTQILRTSTRVAETLSAIGISDRAPFESSHEENQDGVVSGPDSDAQASPGPSIQELRAFRIISLQAFHCYMKKSWSPQLASALAQRPGQQIMRIGGCLVMERPGSHLVGEDDVSDGPGPRVINEPYANEYFDPTTSALYSIADDRTLSKTLRRIIEPARRPNEYNEGYHVRKVAGTKRKRCITDDGYGRHRKTARVRSD
ncbi:hypothetical protein LTR56_002943 [Elasticomyces elasticus]|nr:hypothetical protein LTR22_014666 [Elasticomyces elasticus]KAK3656595.1 hypothetical protein LTR56_002943 [Elasticomyces elasticus]KAK4930728.1 hypothetical protein LTR49_002816 [Elasticomyces elasticus]